MASKQKTDQTVRMATMEQIKQLIAIIVQAIPVRVTYDQAAYWVGHARELAAKIKAIFQVADPYRERLTAWELFYREFFGITVDLSGLAVPEPREGFSRLIVVVPGITIELVLRGYVARGAKVWRWTNDNLDALTESDRTNHNSPYAVWVRDTQEPDPETANKSYNDLKATGFSGVTLLERLLHGLMYFLETGQHLDVVNITRCDGSLFRGGDVPRVFFYGGEVGVGWYDRGRADAYLRCREVVDFKP